MFNIKLYTYILVSYYIYSIKWYIFYAEKENYFVKNSLFYLKYFYEQIYKKKDDTLTPG